MTINSLKVLLWVASILSSQWVFADYYRIDFSRNERGNSYLALTAPVLASLGAPSVDYLVEKTNTFLQNGVMAETVDENDSWLIDLIFRDGDRLCKNEDPNLSIDLSSLRLSAGNGDLYPGSQTQILHDKFVDFINHADELSSRSLYSILMPVGILGMTLPYIFNVSATFSGTITALGVSAAWIFAHRSINDFPLPVPEVEGSRLPQMTVREIKQALMKPSLVFSSLKCVGKVEQLLASTIEAARHNNTLSFHPSERDVRADELYNQTCPICLVEFTQHDPMIYAQCRHGLHKDCGLTWLTKKPRCAICNALWDATTRTTGEYQVP